MKFLTTAAALAILVATAGCATKMLTDERLRTHTAPLIGASASDITILDRTEQGTNTFYTVKTGAGAEYSCSINGGGILSAGMVQGGQCTKKPEPPKAASSVSKPAAATQKAPEPTPTKKAVKK